MHQTNLKRNVLTLSSILLVGTRTGSLHDERRLHLLFAPTPAASGMLVAFELPVEFRSMPGGQTVRAENNGRQAWFSLFYRLAPSSHRAANSSGARLFFSGNLLAASSGSSSRSPDPSSVDLITDKMPNSGTSSRVACSTVLMLSLPLPSLGHGDSGVIVSHQG